MKLSRWLAPCSALTTVLLGVACAQEPVELSVEVPANATPVLVLEGVDIPGNVGLRITVHELGRRLGSASFVGSASAAATSRGSDRIAQVIIALEPVVAARLLADKKKVTLTVTARTVPDDKPSAVKVERAYFRTTAN